MSVRKRLEILKRLAEQERLKKKGEIQTFDNLFQIKSKKPAASTVYNLEDLARNVDLDKWDEFIAGFNRNPLTNKKDVDNPDFFGILRPDEIPKDTQHLTKLMTMYKSRPGIPVPLYARQADGRAQGFLKDEWTRAETQRPAIGGKDLAYRPGLHAVGLPIFDQGEVQLKSGPQRLWMDVEMPTFKEATQFEADTSPFVKEGNTKGKRVGVQRDLAPDEAYNYKTNTNASEAAESWPIAGSMKVNRVMSDDEIRDILTQAGKQSYIDKNMSGIDAKAAEAIDEQMRQIREALLYRKSLLGI